MFAHYVRMLLRKQPAFTAINLAGLVLGMSACLLILKYVQYEYAYDKQSPYHADIWRVFNQTLNGETVVTEDANSHSAVGPTLKETVPQVVDFARLYNGGQTDITVLVDGRPFEVARFYCADQGFMRMFPQTVLQGNAVNCLEAPGGAVITANTAQQIFGTTTALGRAFSIGAGMCAGDYTVSAVVADPPENTHLKFNLLTSFATRRANGHTDNFESYWDYTYVQVQPSAGPEPLRHCLAGINEQYLKQEGIRLDVQAFDDIHLYSNLTYELEPNGSARTVRFLGIIAFFILCIAFINYINLATALAGERAKEVGIRKAVGAGRRVLVWQFLSEHGIVSAVAFVASALFVSGALPWFGAFIGRPLVANGLGEAWPFWGGTALVFLGMSLVSALYPTLLLSGFAPIPALRGQAMGSGAPLRRGLVVLQFALATGLLFGVLVVGRQLDFLKNHDLGLRLDQLVAFKAQAAEGDTLQRHRLERFKAKCAEVSGISEVTASSMVPSLGLNAISGSNRPLHWVKNPIYARATSYFINTDERFFDLYGIRILAGKPILFPDRVRRYSHVAINRAMLEVLGFPNAQSAVGEEISFENAENGFKSTITAVVDNFHIESLKTPPKPTLYYCFPAEDLPYLTVKIEADDLSGTLAQLGRIWEEVYPEQVFRYWFLDEHFAAQYQMETRFGRVFGFFAGLAVLLSCLGLFGLATYHAERRTKEIGIRKVLGASVASVAALLAKDFLKLVLIAIVIASPIAYYCMRQWLSDFAYRIQMEWWMFVGAGAGAVAIAFLMVGFQSLKTALANPIKSLRSE